MKVPARSKLDLRYLTNPTTLPVLHFAEVQLLPGVQYVTSQFDLLERLQEEDQAFKKETPQTPQIRGSPGQQKLEWVSTNKNFA